MSYISKYIIYCSQKTNRLLYFWYSDTYHVEIMIHIRKPLDESLRHKASAAYKESLSFNFSKPFTLFLKCIQMMY